MIVVLSPSKTQEFKGPRHDVFTLPALLSHSEVLISDLKRMGKKEIAQLMKVSDTLAELNYQRYHNFHLPFDPDNARQALLAFRGDVYEGMDAQNYTSEDFSFAQKHLRILSGLYGVLRPLDLIQPYRLEMGLSLINQRGKNLYEFWGNKITELLNQSLSEDIPPILVNLASQEYFKVIKPKELGASILTVSFKEKKGEAYKVVGFFAKRARGMMADFIIKNRITKPEDMQHFAQAGYRFTPELSGMDEWVFCRDE